MSTCVPPLKVSTIFDASTASLEPEPFCTSPENTQLLWTASEETIGETFVVE